MTIPTIIKFADEAERNPAIRARCEAAPDVTSLITIAAEVGFELSVDEVKGYLSALQRNDEELSDEQLDSVAGGVNVNNTHYTDPYAVNVNNTHYTDPYAVNINNTHRNLFGGITFP